jgi:hypothetical protein
LRPARVASGALALPLALHDSLAGAVPGFASASSGGLLAKLASLPVAAKLAAAGATLTAAGTIGFVELDARDRGPAVSQRRNAAAEDELGSAPRRHHSRVWLVRAPESEESTKAPARRREDDEDEGEAGAREGAGRELVEDGTGAAEADDEIWREHAPEPTDLADESEASDEADADD